MLKYSAQSVTRQRFVLGESPCYLRESGEVSWVDIKRGELWRMNPEGALRCMQMGQYLGAAIPTTRGGFVVLMTTGAYLADETGLTRRLGAPADMTIHQRFNDAKCDARGRLFAGTIPLFGSHFPKGGRLYRMNPDGTFDVVADHTTVANGLAWSLDNTKMFLIDTAARSVDVFDYDIETGTAGGRRSAFVVDGMPDGMTIDNEGMLWVAIWGGGAVRCYDPETGLILAEVEVPSRNTASCCFGGEDMKTLYVTTSAEEEPENPMAGCIFSVRLPVAGAPTQRFREEN